MSEILLELCGDSGPPYGGRWRWRVSGASVALAIGAGALTPAHADPSVVLPNGLPVQVHPTFQEPGLPAFSFPTGGAASVSGSSGSVTSSDSGSSGSGSGVSGSSSGTGAAYDMMMAQTWGSDAAAAAAAMGVNATALAATCAMESNCQNVGTPGVGSSATGAFQMIDSTYTADINGAVAYDPDISNSIVSGVAGKMDPGTEAYAASYELRSDVMLQNDENISNPTVLDVRAVYQFGAGVGPAVAAANDSDNIAQLTGLSAASLAANGLTSSSTVGQWRSTIINKLGAASASQTVLSQ